MTDLTDQPIDLSQVPDSNYIPAGEKNLPVLITETKDTASKDKGTPGVVVIMQDELGRTIRHTFWLVEAAYFMIKKIANAAGIEDIAKFRFKDLVDRSIAIDTILDGTYTVIPIDGFHDTETQVKPAPKNDPIPF